MVIPSCMKGGGNGLLQEPEGGYRHGDHRGRSGAGGRDRLRGQRRLSAFDSCHPAVPTAFFAAALVLTMAAVHPLLTLLSLAAAIACGVLVRGARAVVRALRWQVPLVLLVALANPLFSASGSTELFRLGPRAVYAESLFYGLVMGMLLVAVVAWFFNASSVLTSDKVMAVFGGALPVVSLMISMALRLVPRFVDRGRDIADVHAACSAARAKGFKARLRQTSVLMEWSMEDSLETADAMRARGWRRGQKRTRYRRGGFTAHDMALVGVLAVLAVVAIAVAWAAVSQYRFYPTLTPLRPWWGYGAWAVFLLYPFIVQGEEALKWRR